MEGSDWLLQGFTHVTLKYKLREIVECEQQSAKYFQVMFPLVMLSWRAVSKKLVLEGSGLAKESCMILVWL